ncbi:MAG TPA: alginate export family protein [Dyadobacter sp.]|nr:alginate export family protein [Dyadobacter sp.]
MRTVIYSIASCLCVAGVLLPAEGFAQLNLSGQLRTRTELLHGQGTPLNKGEDPAFFTSQRTRLNAGYKAYRMNFFIAIQDVRVWGQDASTSNRLTNLAQNGLMLHEAWGEISLLDTNITKTGKELGLKIGRQELVYDDSRLLGNLDWLQQGRRHDAIVLKYAQNGITAHAGAAYNQNRELKTGGLYDGVPTGYAAGTNGIGTMYKSMQFAYASKKLNAGNVSLLVFKDDFQRYSLNETSAKVYRKGTWNRVTAGTYLNTKIAKSWNLNASAYLQTGKDKDGSQLSAYMYSVKGLYTASKHFALGPGFDYMSGSQANSKINHTFDPLYGTPHKFWGQMDYFYVANGFGKGGLSDFYIHSTYNPTQKLSIQTDLHHFSSAAGVGNGESQTLSSNFGNELDIIATYNLTKSISFQGGYCTFLATNSLAYVKGVKDPQKMSNWAYLMINIKPEFLK